MNLDLPIFSLKPLKKLFYKFLFFIILVSIISILCVAILPQLQIEIISKNNLDWMLIGGWFVLGIYKDYKLKLYLKKINYLEKLDSLIEEYTKFYKSRLIWSGLSFCFAAIFYLITYKNLFFYLLLFQLFMSFILYPKKVLITKELKDREFIFI